MVRGEVTSVGWREREKERKRDSQLRTLDREKFQAKLS